MGPSKRQKLDRESNAAYVASQPLFDALRNGAAKVSEQKAHLSKARDTVQQLHVELVDTNNTDDVSKHELYMDCAVKAWRSATETFSNIFEELCKITAADATKGREASKEYEDFKLMAETAATAREAASNFEVAGEWSDAEEQPASTPANPAKRARVEHEEEDDDDSDNIVESVEAEPTKDQKAPNKDTTAAKVKRAAPADVQPTAGDGEPSAKVQKLSDNICYDDKGHKVLWEKGAKEPNVPLGAMDVSEKKAWKAERDRQKRQEKRQKKQTRARNATTTGANTEPIQDSQAKSNEATGKPTFGQDYIPFATFDEDAEPVPAGKENKIPNVEYEDVSAEVAARLKAKEERRKAKKEEKKRKRESGDSEVLEAVAAVEKPSKKKAKTEGLGVGANGVDARAKAAVTDKQVKRKPEGVDAVEADEGRKKRKKSKA